MNGRLHPAVSRPKSLRGVVLRRRISSRFLCVLFCRRQTLLVGVASASRPRKGWTWPRKGVLFKVTFLYRNGCVHSSTFFSRFTLNIVFSSQYLHEERRRILLSMRVREALNGSLYHSRWKSVLPTTAQTERSKKGFHNWSAWMRQPRRNACQTHRSQTNHEAPLVAKQNRMRGWEFQERKGDLISVPFPRIARRNRTV